MVEALIAVLVVVVVLAAVRGWWRDRGSASGTGETDQTADGPPDRRSIQRSPTRPDDDRAGTEVTTAYEKGMDATEEGNRIWEDAMADWEAEDYDAAADGFGWAETQYSAAAELFEQVPTASTGVWEPEDEEDDDGPRQAAQTYETAARHMRLAAERASEGEFDRSAEHVETARETLTAARAGSPEVGPVDEPAK